MSIAASIIADWRRNQNSMNWNMIKKWASEKSFSIQNITQQMKTMIRDRKIWMKIIENQKTEMCSCQTTCCSLQDKKYNDHLDKNKQNWSCNVLKQDVSVQNRIFCLSMQLSKKNCSTCDNILFSFHWDKTSNSKFMHRLNKH